MRDHRRQHAVDRHRDHTATICQWDRLPLAMMVASWSSSGGIRLGVRFEQLPQLSNSVKYVFAHRRVEAHNGTDATALAGGIRHCGSWCLFHNIAGMFRPGNEGRVPQIRHIRKRRRPTCGNGPGATGAVSHMARERRVHTSCRARHMPVLPVWQMQTGPRSLCTTQRAHRGLSRRTLTHHARIQEDGPKTAHIT